MCGDAALIDEVVLCVVEACTNAIRHSGSKADMDVSLALEGDQLIAEVSDDGQGFDVGGFDPDTMPDLLATGGRGLYLIAHLMDELELSSDGGVRVRMIKRGLDVACAPAAFDGATGDLQEAAGDRRETRLRALLEEIDEGFLALDWEYRYVFVNEVAQRMVGKTADELLGRTPFEIWPRLRGSPLEQHYREAMEIGKPSMFDRDSPATGRWLETRVYPTSGGVSVYLREITRRKRIEEEREILLTELRRSERRFRATFEQAAVGMVHITPDGHYARANERFCRLLGLSADEVRGRDFREFTHPDDVDEEERLIEALVAGRTAAGAMDKRYVRTDGGTIWASITMSLVHDEAGAPEYLVAAVQDIGERKEAEAVLQRYRLLWDEARDILLFVRRRDGGILAANKAAEEAYGRSQAELLGSTVFDLRADSRDVVRAQMDAAAGHGLLFETLHRRADGSTFPVEVSSRQVAGFGDEAVLLSVVRDIRERRSLGSALARERDALATVMANTTANVAYLDRDFRFIMVNDAFAKTSGLEPAKMVGLHFFDLRPDEGTAASFRQVCDTGEAVEYLASPFEFADRLERGVTYWDWRLSPVKDEGGEVQALVLSLVEVTDRARRTRYAEAANAIMARVAAMTEPEAMLAAMGEGVRDALGADHWAVWEFRDGGWSQSEAGDLEKVPLDRPLSPEESPYSHEAMTSGSVVTVEDTRTDPRGYSAAARAIDVRAALAAPLGADGDAFKVMFFSWLQKRRVFTRAGVEFVSNVVAAMREAMAKARTYQDQRRIATMLQEDFIHPLPSVEGVEFAVASETAYEPDLVGGDFHDVFGLRDGSVAVLVGDVEGKGVRAAGLTETVRSAVRTLALLDTSPAFMLGNVNELLLHDEQQFVTAGLMVVDPVSGAARYASAAHPPPLLLADGGCGELTVAPGTPLGAFPWHYDELVVELQPNDVVVLYTDGLIEARRDGEQFGGERALAAARAAREGSLDGLVRGLRDAATAFGGELRDDMQIVAFRLLPRA